MFAERMNHKGNQQGYNNDNSWGGQNVRKSYDYYQHSSSNNRGGDYQHHEGGKFEQRMQSLRLDNDRSSKGAGSGGEQQQQQQSSGPKKMTWATIASQPAKPQVSTISTTIKKKGPGMPPPPIIPGKHSLELNDSWDTPKNGPLVPPSPPVITAPPPIDLSSLEKQNNSNFDGQPAWPTPDQAVSQVNTNNNNSQQQGNSQQAQQQQPPQQHSQSRGYNNQYNNNNNNHNNGNNNYHRGQYNNQNNSYNNHHQQHQQQQHYNDNYKPYHQNPHQMPTAPTSQNQSSANEYRERMPRNNMQQQHQQQRHEPPPPSAQAALPIAPTSQTSSSAEYKKPIAATSSSAAAAAAAATVDENVLEQLRGKNQYNPAELDLSQVENARFFVIKSYSEDDIHRSIKYEIWCSTEHGNKRLDQAFRERERENGIIYLFFSVNSSGHFCGVAQMMTPVDYNSNSSVWSQDKWKGSFRVKWIYVKDVPNTQLRHIRLENNENKPVTNSRDTQEVPNEHGVQIMKIVHAYKHTTSIFDDFTHYEKRQEEEDTRKHESHDSYRPMTLPASHHSTHNRENANRQQQQYNDRGSYDRGDRGGDRERNDYSNGSGYDRGNSYNNGGGSYNKYGSGYNNDYKPSFNGNRGGYNKRNDFRNGGDQQPQSGGFYRANNNDDFGNRGGGGGYRSDRGGSSRGRGGGGYRPPMNN